MDQDNLTSLTKYLEKHLTKPEGKEDWIYHDQNWLTKEEWNVFADTLGDDFELIAMSTATSPDGPRRRGQFFVSPEVKAKLDAK